MPDRRRWGMVAALVAATVLGASSAHALGLREPTMPPATVEAITSAAVLEPPPAGSRAPDPIAHRLPVAPRSAHARLLRPMLQGLFAYRREGIARR